MCLRTSNVDLVMDKQYSNAFHSIYCSNVFTYIKDYLFNILYTHC